MNDYFFIGQVLMPKIAYAGQKLKTAVNNTTTPIQPHTPIVPVAASAINAKPSIARIARSIFPTLIFILSSLYGLLEAAG